MNKEIKFNFDEHTLIKDQLGITIDEDDTSFLENYDEAYGLFTSDEINDFNNTLPINGLGVIYSNYDNIADFIFNSICMDMEELITDFREWVKRDFEDNSRDSNKHNSTLIYRDGQFYTDTGKKLLTLSVDKYDLITELITKYEYNELLEIEETENKELNKLFNLIYHNDFKYLKLDNVSDRINKLLDTILNNRKLSNA